MKTLDEIRSSRKVIVKETADDWFDGFIDLSVSKRRAIAVFVASWGLGWDHVSISFRDRRPTWDEMCEVKDIFFKEDEACVKYHPAKAYCVNILNIRTYCFHICRPQEIEILKPPIYMV